MPLMILYFLTAAQCTVISLFVAIQQLALTPHMLLIIFIGTNMHIRDWSMTCKYVDLSANNRIVLVV